MRSSASESFGSKVRINAAVASAASDGFGDGDALGEAAEAGVDDARGTGLGCAPVFFVANVKAVVAEANMVRKFLRLLIAQSLPSGELILP